jgi:hypothetical protein
VFERRKTILRREKTLTCCNLMMQGSSSLEVDPPDPLESWTLASELDSDSDLRSGTCSATIDSSSVISIISSSLFSLKMWSMFSAGASIWAWTGVREGLKAIFAEKKGSIESQ